MTIGEAARASGVSAKMIRYYERTKLIPAVVRTPSGYRDYSSSDVRTLRFIRRARDLGFLVTDIHRLLCLWRSQTRESADVKRIASVRIEALRQNAESLRMMAETLQILADCCAGDTGPGCPILAELENPGPTPHSFARRRGAIRRIA